MGYLPQGYRPHNHLPHGVTSLMIVLGHSQGAGGGCRGLGPNLPPTDHLRRKPVACSGARPPATCQWCHIPASAREVLGARGAEAGGRALRSEVCPRPAILSPELHPWDPAPACCNLKKAQEPRPTLREPESRETCSRVVTPHRPKTSRSLLHQTSSSKPCCLPSPGQVWASAPVAEGKGPERFLKNPSLPRV